jgi:branched-chain amino acid transport system substrate-binding protein
MRSVHRLAPVLALAVGVGLAAGCGGDDALSGEPITIALLTPKTGDLASIGESFERVFLRAVEEINAKDGIEGRPLVPVVRDTEFVNNTSVAPERLREVLDLGAVAVVGPAASSEVSATYQIARDAMVPMISPSSTLATLSKPEVMDNGYLFRNVPDDETQSGAVAYYLRQLREPPVTSIAIVYEDSDYGRGLLEGTETAFEALGGTVAQRIAYPPNLPSPAAIIDELAAGNATMTVLVAFEAAGIALTKAWATSGKVPAMQWLFTDGARTSRFLAETPDKAIGMCGTAATFPVNGLAYSTLTRAYEGLYGASDDPGVRDLDAQIYAPNVWDAVHLFGLAMVQQTLTYPGEPIGGAHLRDLLTEVSTEGQVFRADQWRNMVGSMRSGGDVDYDGAAGPNNFDMYGQAVGPYEVWCIDKPANATERVYVQAEFVETATIEGLGAPAP